MTTPTTFDMTSNGPSRFLVRPLPVNATEVHLPFGSWHPEIIYADAIGPLVEIGQERLRMVATSAIPRANMAIAVSVSAGATQLTVDHVADVDASSVRGVTNALTVGAENVTVVDTVGTTLILSAPLTVAKAAGESVVWQAIPAQNHHLKHVVTVVRGDAGLAHPRGAQAVKLYGVSEFVTHVDAGIHVTLTWGIGGVSFYDVVPLSTYKAGTVHSMFSFPVTAGAVGTLDVTADPWVPVGLPYFVDVELHRVADATGVPTAPSYWYATGSTWNAGRLVFDPLGGSPSTADLEISAGNVRFLTAGWYVVHVAPGSPRPA